MGIWIVYYYMEQLNDKNLCRIGLFFESGNNRSKVFKEFLLAFSSGCRQIKIC